VNRVGRNAEEILDSLCTVLNEGSGLSIIKYLVIFKELFVPALDCACPICVCVCVLPEHTSVRR